MKSRLLSIIICAVVFTPLGWSQSAPISGFVISQYGQPVPNVPVYVCSAAGSSGLPCTPLASVFYDYNLQNPAPNPISTDANGNYNVYVGPLAFPNVYIANAVTGYGTPTTQLYPGPNCPLGGCTFTGIVTAPTFNATSSPYYEINGTGIFPVIVPNGGTSATTAAGAYANIVAPNLMVSVTQDPFDASPNLSDNYAALNAAYTYAQANNTCLYFPAGIYQIKSALTWDSGVTLCLKGDGLGKSFIYYTGTSTVDSALLVHNSAGFAQMDLTDIGFLANQNASYALHGEQIGGASSMDGVMANGGSVSAFEGDGFNFEGDVRNLNIGQSVNLATGLSLPCANGATFAEYVPAGIPSGQFSLTMPNIEACTGIGLNMTDSSAVPVNGGQISSNHQQLYMNCTVGCNANGSTFNQVLIEDCTSGVLCPDGVNSVASRIDGDGNVFIGVNFGFANALQVYGNKNEFEGRSEMWVAVESGATGNIFVNDELLSSSTNAGTNTTGYGNLDQTDARASLFNILNVNNANVANNIGGTPLFVNGATSGGGLMAIFNPANATSGNYGIQILGEGGDSDVFVQYDDVIWAGNTGGGQMNLKSGPGGTLWAQFEASSVALPNIAPSSGGPDCLQIAATTGAVTPTAAGCGSVTDGAGTTTPLQFAESTSTSHLIQYRTPTQALADIGAQSVLLTGTTGTITGTSLTASCDSGTASVTGAVVGTPVGVSSATGADVGGAFYLRASVTSTGVVTVYVCGTGTPTSLAYNVTVL